MSTCKDCGGTGTVEEPIGDPEDGLIRTECLSCNEGELRSLRAYSRALESRINELDAAATEAHDILTDGTRHDTAGRAWAVLDRVLFPVGKPTNMRSET